MCGLFGLMSSNVFGKHRDTVKILAYLSAFRGEDATGIAAVRNNRDVSVFKKAEPSWDFIKDPRCDSHMRFTDNIWIGHTRAGTIGAKTRLNAHPFEVMDNNGVTDLVGCHNGTLKNKHEIDPNPSQYGTDSEALINLIYHEGVKEAISRVEGAWALSWFDKTQDNLFFLRNKDRTLYYAYEKDKKGIVWASEIWMIRIATQRAGLELDEDKVYAFDEDTLYRFSVPSKAADVVELTMERGLVGKPERFFPATTYGTGFGGQNRHQPPKPATEAEKKAQQAEIADQVPTGLVQVRGNNIVPFRSGTPTQGNLLQLPQRTTLMTPSPKGSLLKTGYKGAKITKAELKHILDEGCAWCEINTVHEDEKFAFIGPKEVVCSMCLTDTHPVEEDMLNCGVN